MKPIIIKSMSPTTHKKQHHARGLTLIELMIAMTLGLIVSAGVIKVFISGKQAYIMVRNLNETQEQGQFALHLLSKSIQMAGYNEISSNGQPDPFYYGVDCAIGTTSCTHNGNDQEADTLAIQLNPPTNQDCTGVSVGENDIIVNVYYLTNEDLAKKDETYNLYCRGYHPATGTWISTETKLVGGIDSMQFQFGEKDADGFQYRPASQVDTWSQIKSVRIALLSASPDDLPLTDDEREYALLDSGMHLYSDKKIRKIYSTTAFLNNIF